MHSGERPDATAAPNGDDAERLLGVASSGGGGGGDVPPSQRVLRTVASLLNVDSLELPPLYESVDPDALDALFAEPDGLSGTRTGTLSFAYAGCTVFVDGDGSVTVREGGVESGT
ncbi:HalOD1 output domain-containing protein [Halorubellus salinus]|uniref:HalOD1 output domain-containing protein n=1 Tax=Halorubellus salinus TaxID=755309 RepID=UPI001D097391|nr:HalOD1 output domain-containing protein [Halorubellus salinus]